MSRDNLPPNIAAAFSSGRGELALVDTGAWSPEEQTEIRRLLSDLINDRADLRIADHHLRDVVLEHRRSTNGNMERLEQAVTRLAKAIQGDS